MLETGATSWTPILDAVRLGPADDATAVAAAQLRDVVERLVAAGQWAPSGPDIVIVTDAGYDVTRLAWILRVLPVELVGRVRGDRVCGYRSRHGSGGQLNAKQKIVLGCGGMVALFLIVTKIAAPQGC
ncbi:transposase [Streptomyces sp. NPDC005533]|uniref:transposase n=1 Tax=Streptomyces sp. NPDC005533 TaxID=3364723 RepID=UPI0036872179